MKCRYELATIEQVVKVRLLFLAIFHEIASDCAKLTLNKPIIITEESEVPLLKIVPWVNYVVPLAVNNDTIGLLMVGRPIPDGYLNAEQADFIRQIANVMAVTIEAIQRFDALRLVARKLLADRYETQLSLANRIHNEPLQQISSLKNDMLHFSNNNSL